MARKPRKDVVRNNRAILRATGELLRDDPTGVNIPAVADRAGLSAPTVYRYYASTDALLGRYMIEVLAQLRDFSHECEAPGIHLFAQVLTEWGSIIEVYGSGLVQLRSRRGYLERLDAQDPLIATTREAWERPLRRLLKAEQIEEDRFESALFLLNLMFDPRDLLDLSARGHAMPDAIELMRIAYVAALREWRSLDAARV